MNTAVNKVGYLMQLFKKRLRSVPAWVTWIDREQSAAKLLLRAAIGRLRLMGQGLRSALHQSQ